MIWQLTGGTGAARVWRSLLLGLLVLGWMPAGRAADPTDEVKRLREELDRARSEIRTLREENARLKSEASRRETPSTGAAITATPPAIAAPAPVGGSSAAQVMTVPAPLPDGSTVTIEQLLADYRTSTLGGDARYKGRRFRLEGNVHSFKKAFVGLTWIVELQSGDKLGLVRCSVSFPGLSDFQPSPGNRILEGRRPFRAWQKILEVGERVSFEGTGAGVDGALVIVRDCRPVAP